MLNEIQTGKITGSTTKEKVLKHEDGTKEKVVMKKIKYTTSSIDEETFQKTFPGINTHNTAMVPSLLLQGKYGRQVIENLCLDFRAIDEEDYSNEMDFLTLKDCEIEDLSVKNDNNIFTYIFTITYPVDVNVNNKYIDDMTGKVGEFKFYQKTF